MLKNKFLLLVIFFFYSFYISAQTKSSDYLYDLSLEELMKLDYFKILQDGEISDYPSVQIEVFDNDEIRKTGLSNIDEVLQFFVPSINFSRPSLKDGSISIFLLKVKGIGPEQTLVLVKGNQNINSVLIHLNKEVDKSSTLSNVSIHFIDRIEIIKDFPVGTYGNENVAGIVNIIMKSESGRIN